MQVLLQSFIYKFAGNAGVSLKKGFHSALQGKSHVCIPFLGIARPQSQFPHLCVCERFIYSQDQFISLHISLQQNRQTDPGNI
jgi:hypothetical protein